MSIVYNGNPRNNDRLGIKPLTFIFIRYFFTLRSNKKDA